MRFGEKLTVVVAVLTGLFGLVMLAGVLIGLLERTSDYSFRTNLVLSFLFGVFPFLGGVLLYRRVRGAVARRQEEEREATVLRVVRARQGIVTAVDVAADSGMALEQAQETLDQLHLRGFNEMDVSESGTVLYRFRL